MGLRPGDFGLDDWKRLLARLRLPQEQPVDGMVPDRLGPAVVDPSAAEYAENSLARRCELIAGLILAAEDALYLSEIPDFEEEEESDGLRPRALAVVGGGPSALFGMAVALMRNIPVLHMWAEDVPFMAPFVGARTRWISPCFYDTTEGRIAEDWIWSPAAIDPRLGSDADLAALAERFSYGHECADDIARRWVEAFAELTNAAGDLYQPRPMKPEDLACGVENRDEPGTIRAEIADYAREWEDSGFEGVGLLLSCRLCERESYQLRESGRVVYSSIPYWHGQRTEPWMQSGCRVVVSGGGDGALQDFLRAVWGWSGLHDAGRRYREILFGGEWPPAVVEVFADLDARTQAFREMHHDAEWALLARYKDEACSPSDERRALRKRIGQVFDGLHAVVEAHAEELSRLVTAENLLRLKRKGGHVILRTRRAEFSRCYPHNHFFALLTTLCLRRHVTWIVQRDEDFRVTLPDAGEQMDTANYEVCAVCCRRGGAQVAGVGAVDTVLIRHGMIPYLLPS